MKPKPCKDCEASDKPPMPKRPAPFPGPRCATHNRAEKKRAGAAVAERRNQQVYGLGPGEYDQLYRMQGGRCAICQRATGATRRLSVDHDHATGEVRGLLCRPCNTMLGHGRDSKEFFRRALDYLHHPPYKSLGNDSGRYTYDA